MGLVSQASRVLPCPPPSTEIVEEELAFEVMTHWVEEVRGLVRFGVDLGVD